jgi:hypothetical protein
MTRGFGVRCHGCGEKIPLKGKENACEQKAEAREAAVGTLAALVNHGAGPPVAQEGRRHGGRLE